MGELNELQVIAEAHITAINNTNYGTDLTAHNHIFSQNLNKLYHPDDIIQHSETISSLSKKDLLSFDYPVKNTTHDIKCPQHAQISYIVTERYIRCIIANVTGVDSKDISISCCNIDVENESFKEFLKSNQTFSELYNIINECNPFLSTELSLIDGKLCKYEDYNNYPDGIIHYGLEKNNDTELMKENINNNIIDIFNGDELLYSEFRNGLDFHLTEYTRNNKQEIKAEIFEELISYSLEDNHIKQDYDRGSHKKGVDITFLNVGFSSKTFKITKNSKLPKISSFRLTKNGNKLEHMFKLIDENEQNYNYYIYLLREYIETKLVYSVYIFPKKELSYKNFKWVEKYNKQNVQNGFITSDTINETITNNLSISFSLSNQLWIELDYSKLEKYLFTKLYIDENTIGSKRTTYVSKIKPSI